jgi:hypothetical protein
MDVEVDNNMLADMGTEKRRARMTAVLLKPKLIDLIACILTRAQYGNPDGH